MQANWTGRKSEICGEENLACIPPRSTVRYIRYMADPSEDAVNSNQLNKGNVRLREFEKAMRSLMKEPQSSGQNAGPNLRQHQQNHNAKEPQAKRTLVEPQGCCSKCQGQVRITDSASNENISCRTQVRMEPSELKLKLMIKLNTWIADDGNLVVQPSLVDYRDLPAASVGNSGRFAGECCFEVQTQLPGKKDVKKQRARQQLGSAPSQQRQQKMPWKHQEVVSKSGDAPLETTNTRSVGKAGGVGVGGGGGGVSSKVCRWSKATIYPSLLWTRAEPNNHQDNANSDEFELFDDDIHDEDGDKMSFSTSNDGDLPFASSSSVI